MAEEAAAPFRAAGLPVAIEGPEIRVGIGAEALRSVLANLLDNVRQHAGPVRA